jgi:hypothetical protein
MKAVPHPIIRAFVTYHVAGGPRAGLRFGPIGLSFFLTCASAASVCRSVQVTRWP